MVSSYHDCPFINRWVIGTAQSMTTSDAVSLDLNDFPALGSTPPSNPTVSSTSGTSGTGTSYASQAGTGAQLGGSGGVGPAGSGSIGVGTANANQTRDFTADDFPALGGQSQSQNQNLSHNQSTGQENHSHPPGLNGFHSDHSQQQHRQNPLGGLGASIPPSTPGALNPGATQARNVHPGFQQGQGDVDKQQLQRVSPLILLIRGFPARLFICSMLAYRITILSSWANRHLQHGTLRILHHQRTPT